MGRAALGWCWHRARVPQQSRSPLGARSRAVPLSRTCGGRPRCSRLRHPSGRVGAPVHPRACGCEAGGTPCLPAALWRGESVVWERAGCDTLLLTRQRGVTSSPTADFGGPGHCAARRALVCCSQGQLTAVPKSLRVRGCQVGRGSMAHGTWVAGRLEGLAWLCRTEFGCFCSSYRYLASWLLPPVMGPL